MVLLTKQFNLLFQANQVDQTITIFRFRDIINNIDNAVDYSDKLNYGGNQTDNYERITNNLGKLNRFTYADADDDERLKRYEEENGAIYGSGIRRLQNQFLQNSVDYLSLEFAPTLNILSWSGSVNAPIIPIQDSEGDDLDSGLRCLLVAPNTDVTLFTEFEDIAIQGLTEGDTLTSMPFAWFWKDTLNNDLDSLAFSLAYGKPVQALGNDRTLLEDYYESFANLFTRPVIIELDAFLSVVDINNLDFSKPVYIGRPYNAYFFLNRVVEFVGQEYTCGLELLKIS